jgi:muramoyltetrapeptide carboxypeptidase
MDRRSFIKKSGTWGALSLGAVSLPISGKGWLEGTALSLGQEQARILPQRLKKGDLIGLVTPGSPITEEQLQEAVVKFEALGFRVYHRDTVLSQYGYFAGPDRERAEELMHMFLNPEVSGIWCVRGGYGSIRILNYLDYEQIRLNPKVFIGYSDITALLTSVYEQTGLVTYHGPLGVSDFNPYTVESLINVVMDPSRRYRYLYEREEGTAGNPEFDLYTVHEGRAEGRLIGGNISVLDSMIGSRFEPDFEEKIVYLEEVEEKTYRVDKMLFHLLEATNLKKAAGIVMGVFGECNINDEPRLTLKQAIDDLLAPLQIPATYGFAFGHIDNMITIPNGIRARMNAGRNSLRLLEPAVS